MFRFTIRELVLLTLVVAMGLGWWLDHRQLEPLIKRCTRLESLARQAANLLRGSGIDARFTNDNIVVGGIYSPAHNAPWLRGRIHELNSLPDGVISLDADPELPKSGAN